MQLTWKTSVGGADPDDEGFSLRHSVVDEAGDLGGALEALWATFVADVAPAYCEADWDAVIVELSPIRGLFVYPMSSRVEGRPRGPGVLLKLKDLERRAVAQASDPALFGETFAAERGKLVRQYVAAIQDAARRSGLFELRSAPPDLRIEVVP